MPIDNSNPYSQQRIMQDTINAGQDQNLDPRMLQLQRQQKLADMLRQQAMDPGQGQMVSGHYVAPGAGGLIKQLGSAGLAAYMQPGMDETAGALGAERRDVRNRYADALMMALRKQLPQQQGVVLPPEGMEDR